MKRLYQKHPLGLALAWIGAYVVLFSIADSLSRTLGMEKAVTAPVCALFAAALCLWVRRSGLAEACGLCRFRGSRRDFLWFLPLALLSSSNLWGGVTLRLSPAETALYVVSMLGVGLIEELLFRGLLFRALLGEGLGRAMCISSLTFGLGHIVNLLNGAPFLPTLLQLGYASAVGLLFTVIFYKGGSLLPCIAAHAAVNCLSVFAVQPNRTQELVSAGALIAISLAYGAWLWRRPDPA